MPLQQSFHFFGVDLLTAGVDTDRSSTKQRDGTVRLDRGHIARQDVAGAFNDNKSFGRFFGSVVIAQGNIPRVGDSADNARSRLNGVTRII